MRTTLIAVAAGLILYALGAGAVAQNSSSVALLQSELSTDRIEGAKRLVRDGDKKSVTAVLKALVAERDGYTGREMGRAFKELAEDDGFKTCERVTLSWKKPEEMFAANWVLTGLAEGASESGDGIVRAALDKKHNSDISLRAAALEAIGESARAEFAETVHALLNAYEPADDRGNVYETLAALNAARKLCPKDDLEKQKPSLNAMIHVLENTADERIKYFAALGLSRATGQPARLDARWWRHWLTSGQAGDQPEGRTTSGPSFFDAVAVGTRVVFAIDISGSMEWPAEMDRNRGPVTGGKGEKGPDYTGVKTKLDLAKAELIFTLENLPEDYYFNIVTYEQKHQLIDPRQDGLIQATDSNKQRMIAAIKALKANGGTNIHGALVRGFTTVRKGAVKEDPAYDRNAMLEGVDTIFFLTDGTPSWSDESTGYSHQDPKWGAIGNGKFCEPKNILADIARINTFRKVVIHTIAVGKDANNQLMQNLAEQNHGQFVGRG